MFFNLIQNHNPSSSAVILKDKTYSFSEIIKQIKLCSRKLEQFCIKPGDHAAVISENEFDFIPLLFALWNSGAVPVLLNTKLTDRDIEQRISFTDCKYVFIHRELAARLKLILSNRIIFPLQVEISSKSTFVYRKTSKEETALIIFTSGSTGKPKGVMLSFNNLMQSALIGNKVLKISPSDRLLASLPFYHIGGFSIITRALLFGASIIIPDSIIPDNLNNSLQLFKPTITSFVSNHLYKLIDREITPPKELRLVLLGGGFFNKDLILKAITHGWKTAKVYGSTETSSFVSFMPAEEVKKKPDASGKAIPPNKILITNDGEIIIKSPVLMKGYYKDGKETEKKFRDKYYFTGDIGQLDDEGYLFVESKREDLIVSGGENINPAEVENEILSNPKVKEVCVVGLEDKEWGQIVSAAVVIKENSELSENELKEFLKKKLASFKIPKKIIFIKQLPKSELGKTHRAELKELINSGY